MAFGRRITAEESLAVLVPPRPPNVTNSAPPKFTESGEPQSESKTKPHFDVRNPRYRMADLIVPESVHQELTILKSRIQNQDLIYRQWDFQRIDPLGVNMAINFHGPPGTGKTMCVEALAADLGKQILEVSYAEIESKYMGETPKNIVAAFAQARQDGALLFFDEADSILGRRLTNVTQSADHGVNVSRAVMLKQLDNFDGLVAFATNLAQNFDGAFVRRILQHVSVPLPDEPCRLRLWERMVTLKVPGREKIDFGTLAKQSEGLSGGQIKNAVLLALSHAASRAVSHQIVLHRDLVMSLDSVRRASWNVGHHTLPEVSISEVHPSTVAPR